MGTAVGIIVGRNLAVHFMHVWFAQCLSVHTEGSLESIYNKDEREVPLDSYPPIAVAKKEKGSDKSLLPHLSQHVGIALIRAGNQELWQIVTPCLLFKGT